MMMVGVVCGILGADRPWLSKLWEIVCATICMAVLFGIIGLLMYPIVFFWRFLHAYGHPRLNNNERRRPVGENAIRATPGPTEAGIQQGHTNVAPQEPDQ